jgi:uncharacterized protein YyaL (SSP411 family)
VRLLLALVLSACTVAAPAARAPSPKAARGLVEAGTPDSVNIAKARALGREQLFAWEDWSDAAFAKAKAEKRFILVHGAAEWCHWCHVMEETTYRDPEVGKMIRDRFVAIRVDIDSRPDIEDRYGEWGWPATILLDSEAHELGKYQGYLKPADMREILATLDQAARMNDAVANPPELAAAVEALPWIGSHYAQFLDEYYDDKEGSWGMRQKAPIGDDATWELRRFARTGDEAARKRALFSLEKHAELIDPVWGGIYQYSTGGTWKNPHYEKLIEYQSSNLWAYADAYRLTGEARMLEHARAIEKYLDTFLSNDAGAFLVSQDADLNAHDRDAAFVDGHTYYAMGDAERRKHGIPRVDDHVYAEENGLAIGALVALYRATKDPAVLARAEKAANLVAASHVDAEGRVKHDAASTREVWYLADAGAFGLALALLAEVKGGDARYEELARRIATFIRKDLAGEPGDPAFYGHTVDKGAAGVFAARRRPYHANVYAARLFAALWRVTGDVAYRDQARAALAAIAKPSTLRDRGRMIGSFLVALDDADALDWSP